MSATIIHPLLEDRGENPLRLRQLASHARWAGDAYASLPRERIAEITQSVARAIADQAEALAQAMVEERGCGVAADAATLIRGSTQVDLPSCAMQAVEDTMSIAKPAGVALLILPNPWPIAIVIRHALFCLASGNATLLVSADKLDGVGADVVRLICRLAEEAGAPPGLMQAAEETLPDAYADALAEGLIGTIIGDATARSAIYIDETADVALATGRIANSVSFDNGLLRTKPDIAFVHAAVALRVRRELTAAGARWCNDGEAERLRHALFPDGAFDARCAGQPSRVLARKAGIKPFSPSKLLVASLLFGGEDEPLSEAVPCPVIGLRIVSSRDAALRACRARSSPSTRRQTLLYYGRDIRAAADFGAKIDAGRVLFNHPAELGPYDWQTDTMPARLLRRIPVSGPMGQGEVPSEIALERIGQPT